jgi:hypothetical protein
MARADLYQSRHGTVLEESLLQYARAAEMVQYSKTVVERDKMTAGS